MLPLSRVPSEREESQPVSRAERMAPTVDQFRELGGLLPMIVEVLPTPVLVIDDRHRLVLANGEARRLLSNDHIGFVGYSVGRFLSLERLEAARLTLLSRAGMHAYRDSILVGGVEREVEVRVELLESAGEEYLCATLIDQTDVDRERAEWTDSVDTLAPPSTRIEHAHRLEALGHLTGSLAHDFNNLLAVILGSLEAANRRLISGEDPLEDIRRAMTATQRSIETTSNILRYSRDRGLHVEAISPALLLSELRGLIERALGDGVRLEVELELTRRVMVGAAQLETAILNLIINARDAVEEQGVINVTLSRLDLSEKGALELGLLPGAHVCITVSDSGVGMTDEVKARVFEPFYTTKPPGRGTGLGLSTVRSVAQKFGGAVNLTSAVDRGTKVELYFPEVD